MPLNPPGADEIEVSVFSRGYGESIVMHVGEGGWLIIDSLKSKDGQPVALTYLREIGVAAETSVDAVLLTHWHDDHVGGAAKVVEACKSAAVALPAALQQDEFKAFLRSAHAVEAGTYGSGVDELLAVLRALKSQNRRPQWALTNRLLKERREGLPYRLEALSPSDADFESFIRDIATWSSDPGRLITPSRNDASVAAVVEIGEELVLLGADLEVTEDGRGWQNVVRAAWNSRPKATFYKIAHHGSPTGEYGPIWAELLVADVTAALTPWSRGRKLPSQADVDRILGQTFDAHSAARVRAKQPPKRLNTVERALRESGIKIDSAASETGHVRFRKRAGEAWRVEYVGGDSCHLSAVL